MAYVTITIKDMDINNIGIDIGGNPFPESQLLYTNAQMLAKDVIGLLNQLSKQVNDNKHHAAVEEMLKH